MRRIEEALLERGDPRDAAQGVGVPEWEDAAGEPSSTYLVCRKEEEVIIDAEEAAQPARQREPGQPGKRDQEGDAEQNHEGGASRAGVAMRRRQAAGYPIGR